LFAIKHACNFAGMRHNRLRRGGRTMKKSHVMGVVWAVAIVSVGALALILRKPDAHAKFEHPHRQIVVDQPSSIELSDSTYLPPRAAAPAPVEPPPPVVMKGAKIVGEQASTEPQKLAHGLEGVTPTGTTVR